MSNEENQEQLVIDYLKENPDFFVNHEALLAELTLPHATGGAVSLVERQVATLRKQADESRQQLAELISVARDNESLNGRLHKMTLELFDATTIDDVIDTTHDKDIPVFINIATITGYVITREPFQVTGYKALMITPDGWKTTRRHG